MFVPIVRRVLATICALCVLAPAPALAQDSPLRRTLDGAMRGAGSGSGAYVLNATEGRALYARRAGTPRALASNTKLFTTAAALARLGPDTALPTQVLGTGELGPDGDYRGDLYLRGGGDPTFGSRAFAQRAYLSPGGVEALAAQLAATGIRRVSGRVFGDERLFDARRGGPDSGYRTSLYVGPLSALSFNRGLAGTGGSAFVGDPPAYAAARLEAELERGGVTVRRPASSGATPPAATALAEVHSPPVSRLVQVANKRSDNFFAEILLKLLAAGPPVVGDGLLDGRQPARASTGAGAAVAAAYARELGARARIVDGSGLSRANRAAPRELVRLLDALRTRPNFAQFLDSLAVAGRDGTLRDRMRSGPARGRCRGKTGSLAGVSTLSGYCTTRDGDTVVFSVLMNGVYVPGARRLQDRMLQAIAVS